jgi:hypothetical protein
VALSSKPQDRHPRVQIQHRSSPRRPR